MNNANTNSVGNNGCCSTNRSIECTVTQCKNHCGNENYCSLNKIRVGTHEANPTMMQCTDCESFEVK